MIYTHLIESIFSWTGCSFDCFELMQLLLGLLAEGLKGKLIVEMDLESW